MPQRTLHFGLLTAIVAAGCGAAGLLETAARVEVGASVEFGHTYVGERGEAAFEVRSTGSGWLALTAIESGDPAVVVEAGEARVAPGATRTIRLGWTPSAAGLLDTTITVRTDVESAEDFTVHVTGEARVAPDCNDENACTDDRFEREGERCLHLPHDRACDDASACTVEDRCDAGTCRGRARRCDDDDVCTLNFCDPASGCLFPPDERTCDDRDPCTRNVCDREDGCSFPDAEDGTSCGAFSCALAHVCVFGSCRALDVTGISDDLPCFDGDLCTDADSCQEGECVGGSRIQSEPRIVANLETFGGEGSFVGTDGFRYLFTDPVGVRVTQRGRDGLLAVSATLPFIATLPPVSLGNGRFALGNANEVSVVDATDPVHPVVVWTEPTNAYFAVQATNDLPLRQLLRLDGGLVLGLEQRVPGQARTYLVFLPLDPTTHAPQAARLLRSESGLVDADADGDIIATTRSAGVAWFRVLPDGSVTPSRAVPEAGRATRVSVHHRRLAALTGGRLVTVELQDQPRGPIACPPDALCFDVFGCDPSFPHPPGLYLGCGADDACPGSATCARVNVRDPCPTCNNCDSMCCVTMDVGLCMEGIAPMQWQSLAVPDATDLVLNNELIAWTTAEGVFQSRLTPALEAAVPLRRQISKQAAAQVDRGPEHLLVEGAIALPFEVVSRDPLNHPDVLVTGPGHGDLTVVVDAAAPNVRVAGKVAIGEVNLVSQTFSNWRLAETDANAARPRLLAGLTMTTPILTSVNAYTNLTAAPCEGVPLEIMGPPVDASFVPCGLYSANIASNGGSFAAITDFNADIMNSLPPRGLRVWNFGYGVSDFVFELADLPGIDSSVQFPAGPRARVALLTLEGRALTEASVAIRLYEPGMPAPEIGELHALANPENRFFAGNQSIGLDGDLALFALPASDDAPRLGLFQIQHASRVPPGLWQPPSATLEFPDAPSRALAIPSMTRGRAWVGSQRYAGDEGPVVNVLHEVLYDSAGTTLTTPGSVRLPAPPRGVHDTGLYTVATTAAGVTVIAPACQ